MNFGKRLVELRKKRGLTQTQLSELIGVHVAQMRNYELEKSQPTLEVIRKMVLALEVSADELLFDQEERTPAVQDKDLVKHWKLIEELPEEDRKALKILVEGLVLRRQLSRLQPLAELAQSYQLISQLTHS